MFTTPFTLSPLKARLCILLALAFHALYLPAQTITTIAGGSIGDGKIASTIGLAELQAVAFDAAENIYVLDKTNKRVRKIEAATGIITTIAGGNIYNPQGGDGGPALSCSFLSPMYMAIDKATNIYIVDGRKVRKIDGVTGIITTIAGDGNAAFSGDGGPAVSARFSNITAVAVDTAGNIYIADQYRVRKITVVTGIINTIAGIGTNGYSGDGGPAINAQFGYVMDLAVDPEGNVFINDNNKIVVRKVAAATGIISTYVGTGVLGFGGDGGPAANAKISYPRGMITDSQGNLYLTDNSRIRKVTASTGIINTIAGGGTVSGTNAVTTSMYNSRNIAISTQGNFCFIEGTVPLIIRKITTLAGTVATVAGNGTYVNGIGGLAINAQLYNPGDIAMDTAGNIYLTDPYSYRVYRINAVTGTINTVAGGGASALPENANGVPATQTTITTPQATAVDRQGNFYFMEMGSVLRKVDVNTGIMTRIAGTKSVFGYSGDGGPATDALFKNAQAIYVDKNGDLYISDADNHCVRKITKLTGIITTVIGTGGVSGYSGDGGPAANAKLYQPRSFTKDTAGNIYIVDNGNKVIRKVDALTGIISTYAGNGTEGYSGDGGPALNASFRYPRNVTTDMSGNLFIADWNNGRIRKVDVATGIITTLAGTEPGNAVYNGDDIPANTATIFGPATPCFDAAGNLYFTDCFNNRIRKIILGGMVNAAVYYDNNTNGIKDNNEKWADGIKVTIDKQAYNHAVFTKNGVALLEADTGTYVTTVQAPPYYAVVPASKKSIFTDSVKRDNVSFALQLIPNRKDLRVNLTPIGAARPGFSTRYLISCNNVGTAAVTNIPLVVVKSNKVNIVNSVPAYSSLLGDTLIFTIASLQPHDSISFVINAGILPPPTVVNNDVLHTYAYVSVAGEETPADDTARIKQIVTGSYDPNDKLELHEGALTPAQLASGEYLTYVIRFQNTGTDTAFNVSVRDTLDAKLDWKSFQMVAASHDYLLTIDNGNRLSWRFNNILLPDSNVNEKASHGFISFRIKAKTSLVLNDVISNTAAIYFDYNLPVITNTEYTTIRNLQPLPVAPVLNTTTFSYCITTGAQKIKIMNLPASNSATAAKARINTTGLSIAADSTFTLTPQQIGTGTYTLRVEYVNETGEKFINYPLTITAAAEPDVDMTADKTLIQAPAETVTLTASNKKGGGSSPLYTFAKDKGFTSILQPEGSSNKLTINGDNLINGDSWTYVRMKTSEPCFVTATAIDSIRITKNVIATGIVDIDNPAVTISGYPNPFNNQVVIGGLSAAKSYRIYVYDNLGRPVHQQAVYNRSLLAISTTSWKAGSYRVVLFDSRKNKLLGTLSVTKL